MTSSRTAPRSFTRGATIRAGLLVLVGALGVYLSATITIRFFDPLGVLGTSGVRVSLAAIILLLIFRPSVRGRSGREWAGIVLYGAAMTSMSAFLYLAFDRLPMGVATTIDFLGPCVVALAASRRPREGMLAIAAILGVGLIAGFGGPFDPLGILFAALAGASFGLYTVLAARIGQAGGGLRSAALSVTVAAILMLPFTVTALPRMEPGFWAPLAFSALIGMALALSVDTMAGRLTSARVLGVFFAFDPVVGTIIGTVVLGQVLTPVALTGIVLVIGAGAGIVWFAGEKSEGSAYAGGMSENAVETVEIERKYEVGEGSELPSAAALAEVGLTPDEPETVELAAAYFDTPARDLARNRLAVRVRFGGKDAGWHLKMKGTEGARELLWPAAGRMPTGLREEIVRLIGSDAGIAPIAELRTTRRVLRLRDAAGREVVELVDDRVRALDHATGALRAWREWEAELAADADPERLDALEPVLRAAGADPSPSPAKIARASGALELAARAAGAGEGLIATLHAMDAADRAAGLRDSTPFEPVLPKLDS